MKNLNWLVCVGFLLTASTARSVDQPALKGGFEQLAKPLANGSEISRQPDLWMMEISYKQMRHIYTEVTDPQTGEKQKELVWYLCWRAINRELPRRTDADETVPVNTPEPLPGPLKFIPELELTTFNDADGKQPIKTFLDELAPEALAVINAFESPRLTDPRYRDSLKVISDVPQAVASEAPEQPWIYGVAMWRKIDPTTRFFRVAMKGFSNGYEKRPGPGDEAITWRRVLMQKFRRPGDEFDPTIHEYQYDGLPTWIYQPSAPVGKKPQ